MEEKVSYQTEEPVGVPEGLDDWRYQEAVNMAPDAVMDELLGLSEEILDAKTEWEETRFELWQAQERLKLMEIQVVAAAHEEDARNRKVEGYVMKVSGNNDVERKRRVAVFLADHPTIKQLASEIRPLESAESTTRLAMEALLDRQKNLHVWARMFEAQVRLLSTVRMPEIKIEPLPEEAVMTATATPSHLNKDVAAIDELFPPEVTIPPSMGASTEEADAMKAAIKRHDESGPSL